MKNILFAACCMMLMFSAMAQAPVPNFSANVTEGCSPLVVEFKDQTLGNPTSWAWDFGNGGTSTLQNPSTSYFNPGTYTVTLKATNASGSNTVTKTAYITIYNQPVVNFSAPVVTGCTPFQATFTDQSTPPPGMIITGWSWSFGDGGTSTQPNPSYYYKQPGNYTVTLTIQTNKGCTKSLTKPYYIAATDGVKPAFTNTDPEVCSAPATVGFTNTSTGPGNLSYSWSFGDGNTSSSPNPSNTYNSNGDYKVLLFVTSDLGCSDSTSKMVTVGKATTDFIVPAGICPGQPVQFTNNSNPRPITANWQFSNGTSDTLKNGITTFKTPGTYTVTLINTYTACTDTLTKTITTSPLPSVQFSVSDTGKCQAPFTVNFTNSSNGTSYFWDFGDSTSSTQTNPSHTYTKNGDFTVTLIATGANGCSDTLRKPALVQVGRPKISFTTLPAKGCIPLDVSFAASIQSADEITSYNWNFGNGNSSTSQSPSHTYTAAGVYDVSLTVTTRTGCTETFTMPQAVKAGTRPTANFTSDVTSACADPGIQFTNLSTNAMEYLWEFSDGSSSTLKDPRQVFSDTGWIDVKLTASNNGCEHVITRNNYAYIRPAVSRFDYRPSCTNRLEYTFTDRSLGATTWNWNFGDGNTFTGKTPPPHVYPADGTYTVTLTTTGSGCSHTLSRQITIKDLTPDFAAAGDVVGCKPFLPGFYPTYPDKGSIRSYTWDYSDGAPETWPHGDYSWHNFTKPGKYTVSFIVVDSFGCTYTRTKPDYITVNGPVANFTSVTNSGCKGMTTTFTDSTNTNGGGSIVKWTWDFGDGTSQVFQAPPFQHTYDSVGDYDVKLLVEDAGGCRDSITKREFVKVSTLTVDYISNNITCPGGPLYFQDNSKSDYPMTFAWSFGDGGTSTSGNPYHTYSDTGWYQLKLIVKDMVGCEDSLVLDSAVYVGSPKAAFTVNNTVSFCTPFEARFSNKSEFFVSSLWYLGNDTTDAGNPVQYYTNTGTYPITLKVTSWGGCTSTATDTLEIYNPNDGTMTYDVTSGCQPATVNFTSFKPMNARFIWDFGDGNVIDTNSNSITHVYSNVGNFIPKVIMKQPEGCVVPLTGIDTIRIFGSNVKFNIDKYLFCDTGTIRIIDSTITNGRVSNYAWDFGDGTGSGSTSPTHTYLAPGDYLVSLVVETESGCKDSLVASRPVRVMASPQTGIDGDSVICANERLDLIGVLKQPDTSAIVWTWQFPDGTSAGIDPAPRSYPPGTYTVTSRATNSSGCFDTTSRKVIVHALPTITVPATVTKVVGQSITIPAQYSSGVNGYSWTPGSTLSCNDCPQPITTTKFSTNYTVAAVDSNGCRDSATMRVIVLCEGATIFFPNAFSPNGDGSNDVFYPRGSGLDRVKSVRLFNRWGEVVYEQKDFPVNNPAYGWDGRYKGKPPQPGVYIYQAEIFCENGEVIRTEGNVALIQ